MPLWALPLIVLGSLVLVLGLLVLLGRFRGGRYLRPIVALIAKVPFFRRQMMKASAAALERENPDHASAMKKVELYGTPKTPTSSQSSAGAHPRAAAVVSGSSDLPRRGLG